MTAEPTAHVTGVAVSADTTYEPDVVLLDADVNGANHYALARRVTLDITP